MVIIIITIRKKLLQNIYRPLEYMNEMQQERQLPAIACAMLEKRNVGDALWWKQLENQGTPLISSDGESSKVDFFWRDPQGCETESEIVQVILEVNSITDHHSWEPVSLARIAGTDVWHHQLEVESQFCGSYCFIPLTEQQQPQRAKKMSDGSSDAQRQWYISVLSLAQSDAYNSLPVLTSGHGMKCSPLHMPFAEQKEAWQRWDKGTLANVAILKQHQFEWTSQSLKNSRQIVFFATNTAQSNSVDTDKPLPLVILMDGQRWSWESGTPSVITHMTEQGTLKPACYLLLDSISPQTRWLELGCYSPFWQAIFDELLPLLTQKYGQIFIEDNITIAGQSLGGLSAMYAGLHWPQLVNKVISISGSFWWPDVHRMRSDNTTSPTGIPEGSLAESIQSGQVCPTHLQVFQSVGTHEGDMNLYNDAMAETLQQAGCPTLYKRFCGGHDWLAWRTSLIDGLESIMK